VHTLTGHSNYMNMVSFSVDGKRIFSGSSHGFVEIRDTETGAEVSSFVGIRCWWRGGGGALVGFRARFDLEVVS